MNQELLRIVDALARDKNIDRETIFEDLEAAMLSAIRKANPGVEDVAVQMDRESGDIKATVDGREMSIRELGRIAAQTAKQVMIQRIRAAERDSLYEEYVERKGQIVTGRVARWEGGSLIVDLGRLEAILPRSEQIPGDSHQVEQRIRAMILDVKEEPGQVRIVLSRTHPDFICALFELEVPEVAEGIIEMKVLAREAGYRTKVAVNSLETKVDAVGACVGIRGSRIKNIVEELGGEKIDIVRWNDSSKILIANSLKPAEVAEIALCFELGRAIVVVTDDQLSLAIGKRGQNVRLAARLTGWDIDILTPTEFNTGLDILEKAIREIPGVDSTVVDQVIAMGMVNVLDVEEVGPEPLINELSLDRELAQQLVVRCAQEAKRVAEQQAADKAAEAARAAAEKAIPPEQPPPATAEETAAGTAAAEHPEPSAPESAAELASGCEAVEATDASEPKQEESALGTVQEALAESGAAGASEQQAPEPTEGSGPEVTIQSPAENGSTEAAGEPDVAEEPPLADRGAVQPPEPTVPQDTGKPG